MRLNILPTSMALALQAMTALSELGLQKRYPTGSFSIIAYGVAPEGANIFYSDGCYDVPHETGPHLTRYLGLAYVGDSSQWVSGSVTTDVTCRAYCSFISFAFIHIFPFFFFSLGQTANNILVVFNKSRIIATATNKDCTLDPDTFFYIRPTPNMVLPVGFTGNDVDTPDDAEVDQFLFYGRYLMWQNENGRLCDSFRLKDTDVDDIYQLYWDTSNIYPPGFLIPTVKSSI